MVQGLTTGFASEIEAGISMRLEVGKAQVHASWRAFLCLPTCFLPPILRLPTEAAVTAQTEPDPNRHIIEFLRYYSDSRTTTDYAVMLKGSWGSGKTHLINEFLRERASAGSGKDLYVSLYGLTSFQQIDDALFRQLHPILLLKQ
jgi:hypothetical protein